jgi:hypothetical protein
MAGAAPSRTRSRLLRITAAVAALAAAAGALKLAGAFDDEEEPVDSAPLEAPNAGPPAPMDPPLHETIEVGGRPAAIAADAAMVVAADAAAPAATVIETATVEPAQLALDETATAVAVTAEDILLGLPESRGVELRSAAEPQARGERIELDAIPSAIAADDAGAWVLTESAVQRVEPGADDAIESFGVGGFSTAFDVEGDDIWVVADNREVRRFDASSLEPADEVAEVPDASAIAVGESYAWVLSSTGDLTRLDPGSLRRVGEPERIRSAVALEVGVGSVWVTSAAGTVTRVDPASGRAVDGPVPVGDEPVAISAGEGAIWVANAGDGTVTRITP